MARRASDSSLQTTDLKICSSINPPSEPTATAASPKAKPSSTSSSKEEMVAPRPSTLPAPTDLPSRAIAEAAAVVEEATVVVAAAVAAAAAATVVADMGLTKAAEVEVEGVAGMEVVAEATAVEATEEAAALTAVVATEEAAAGGLVIVAASRGIWRGTVTRAEVEVAEGMVVVEEEVIATTAESKGILLGNALR